MDKTFYMESNKSKFKEDIMPKMWEILASIEEKTGFDYHRILYLGLYGSQNYNMDSPDSDIDCECFIFPSHDDIVFARPLYSKLLQTPYGTCHVKDVRAIFNELRKSSPNILEILYTPYAIINKEYEFYIRQITGTFFNYIASLNKFKLLKGLEGLLNRYYDDLEDPKYLANSMRVYDMICGVLHDDPYDTLITPDDYVELTALKYCEKPPANIVFDMQNSIHWMKEDLQTLFYDTHESEMDEGVLGTINFYQDAIMSKYIKLEF